MFSVQLKTRAGRVAAAVAVWLATACSLASASALQNVRFAELPGDRFQVRLDFDSLPVEPSGYTIDQPARIVLDFAGVDNALSQRKFPLSFENAKSAVILSSGGRTRLILNLNELTTYTTVAEGNALIVEVGGGQAGSEFVSKSTSISDSLATVQASGGAAITGIDFRRGEAGEGKVIVDLSDPSVSIDVDQRGGAVNIAFLGVRLPENLRRSLDVVDFATPVTMVDADYDGDKTTLVIKASGEYDYLAYQADNTYVVSVKPLTVQELEEKKSRFAFSGEKLSLNFQDIEVRSVLQLIADFTELNLVASDTVRGNITLRLDNVPWDQALDLVLKTKGLDKRQVGNVMMVAPAAEIAERERQEIETQKQLQELAPLYTEYIRVRYASAEEIFKLFKKNKGSSGGAQDGATESILSERGSAIIDERTNSIILTDTSDKIEEFRRLIEQIDIPIRQVMIEARIVIANSDFREEMGIKWGVAGVDTPKNSQVAFAGSYDSLDSDPGSPGEFFLGGGTTDIVENLVVDLGVANPAGSFALSFLNDNILLGLEISALEDLGFAEIVSQPKVITGDKQVAHIQSGTEIAYQEAASSGATSVSFKEAVLKLEVTPQITPDDHIIMDLQINQDSIGAFIAGENNSQLPTIDTTELHTQVLVANGQTVVLGGIFQTELVSGETKVPVLGDIPYLGRLFRQNVHSENKRELLIFITPKILSDKLVK
ncbi:type IV pilus secretin PilQ [Pseudomaricurvus alcaniphilus]|uniref:type IV pilus secretin PilQ family protein n=1 Tax=Pseudomaricurvus alcaniphilus TaxID=1166482 RepID=UPI00140C9B40|nr:type IV pilus secretin PilQ family protein [Pseudomaricurvus alcaniphilus]NHN38553.1 type IV pilus secretin PilQ [Pseudomaricurvus alcaniphilus]